MSVRLHSKSRSALGSFGRRKLGYGTARLLAQVAVSTAGDEKPLLSCTLLYLDTNYTNILRKAQ